MPVTWQLQTTLSLWSNWHCHRVKNYSWEKTKGVLWFTWGLLWSGRIKATTAMNSLPALWILHFGQYGAINLGVVKYWSLWIRSVYPHLTWCVHMKPLMAGPTLSPQQFVWCPGHRTILQSSNMPPHCLQMWCQRGNIHNPGLQLLCVCVILPRESHSASHYPDVAAGN